MELPHQPWVTVWTHGSGIARRGDDKLEHLSFDVEELNANQFRRMTVDETKEYKLVYDDKHGFEYPESGPSVYHVSGTVTEKDQAPKEFGMKNLVAIAALDFADELAEETRQDLINLLKGWIKKLENPPSPPQSPPPSPPILAGH